MFTLIHKSSSQFLVREMPPLVIALVLSELLYKLGSFTLECICFLATWYVISFLFDFFKSMRNTGNRNA
jgi:hypothetical protein